MSSVLLLHADAADGERRLAAFSADASLAVCGAAASLAQARAAIARRVPDLLIADLRLPDGALADLLGDLRPGRSHVLALATSVHDPHWLRALRAGVDACLPAATAPATLRRAAHRMLAGESPLVPGIAQRLLALFDPPDTGPADAHRGGWQSLDEAEARVLGWAAAGWTEAEIAQRLAVAPDRVGRIARGIHRRLHVARRRGPVSPAAAGCR